MFTGVKINTTEERSVLHTALRAPKGEMNVSYKEGEPTVHEVLEKIEKFSNSLRNGEFKGKSGKNLANLIVIGIGGSYLSIDYVYEALRW